MLFSQEESINEYATPQRVLTTAAKITWKFVFINDWFPIQIKICLPSTGGEGESYADSESLANMPEPECFWT